MMASKTRLPVIGVPIETRALKGVDSLYSIVQMPRGFPVATMAIGAAGAANAGLMAAAILALSDPALAARLDAWRQALSDSDPRGTAGCLTGLRPARSSAFWAAGTWPDAVGGGGAARFPALPHLRARRGLPGLAGRLRHHDAPYEDAAALAPSRGPWTS
jgi:hypothetical protein